MFDPWLGWGPRNRAALCLGWPIPINRAGSEDVDPVAGIVYQIADVVVDDVGHATLCESRCPEARRCIHLDGAEGGSSVALGPATNDET